MAEILNSLHGGGELSLMNGDNNSNGIYFSATIVAFILPYR